MFRLTKQVFIRFYSFSESLTSIVNVSNHTKCIYLNNRTRITRPTLIELSPDEYNQLLCYYSFMDNLDKCNKSCNTLDNLSIAICVPNKLGIVNLSVFNMITGINE